MVISITRGGFAKAIPSNPPARLELCGAVLSEGTLSVCSSAPSGQTVMMGVTMVGDLLFDAFTCDGLLAKCLAGSLTIAACCTVDSCLVSGLEVVAVDEPPGSVRSEIADEPRLPWQRQHQLRTRLDN